MRNFVPGMSEFAGLRSLWMSQRLGKMSEILRERRLSMCLRPNALILGFQYTPSPPPPPPHLQPVPQRGSGGVVVPKVSVSLCEHPQPRHAYPGHHRRLVDVGAGAAPDERLQSAGLRPLCPLSPRRTARGASSVPWSLRVVLAATDHGARNARVPLRHGLVGIKEARPRRTPRRPFSSVAGAPSPGRVHLGGDRSQSAHAVAGTRGGPHTQAPGPPERRHPALVLSQ